MSAQGTEPDEFVRKMRQGWKNHIGRIRERKGTASSGVQALAKNIEKMEDAVMPTVDECDEAAGDEAGLDDDMLHNGRGAGDPSPPGSPRVAGDVVNAFGVGVRRQVRAAKGRLGVMSLGEVRRPLVTPPPYSPVPHTGPFPSPCIPYPRTPLQPPHTPHAPLHPRTPCAGDEP